MFMMIDRRVINIKKEHYDIIKKYCENNALKISDWVSLEIIKLIKQKENE